MTDSSERDADGSPLRVGIAMPTCNRPLALRRALESLCAIERPTNAELFVIVVDNGDAAIGAEEVCKSISDTAPWPLHFARQQQRGISYARNMILDVALSLECDVLLGLDDDEIAGPQWASRMVAGLRAQAVQLVGGPMDVMADPDLRLTRHQSRMLAALLDEAATTRARQLERARQDSPSRHIYTGNYALDLDFIRRTGLRYDEALSFSGGEDSDFAARLIALGGNTGWVQDAMLVEVLPAARLSALYLFQRNRDFAPNWGRFRGKGALGHAMNAAEEAVDVLFLALPAVLGNRRRQFRLVQKIGRFWGHILAMVGRHTGHYIIDEEKFRT